MAKTVLITGTSSGIGRSAVEYFSQQGWNVVATMRNPECDAGKALAKLDNVIVVPLDVTDEASITNGVKAALDKFGTIDALVNNAGYGLMGPLELATTDQINLQFKTNLIGPILVMQKVLPTMRAAKSGVIVNITSVAGRMVLPINSLYHGSKFGLEGVSEAVALELAPFGIKVRLVEPGAVKTDFAGRSLAMTSSETVHAYDKLVGNVLEKFEGIINTASETIDIVKVIFEAVTSTEDKIRFPAGDDANEMLPKRFAISDEDHHKDTIERFNLTL